MTCFGHVMHVGLCKGQGLAAVDTTIVLIEPLYQAVANMRAKSKVPRRFHPGMPSNESYFSNCSITEH
jgi:hypothetical protein